MGVMTVYPRRNRGSEMTTRERSPNIWFDCPYEQIRNGELPGVAFGDDFTNFSQHVSDQDTQQYSSYIDTGVTIKALPVEYGVIEVAGNDADNDEGSITTGGNTGTIFKLSDAASSRTGPLWFECRIKKASVSDNAAAFFIGLAEEGLAGADTLVNDTGVFKTTADCIGFRVLQDNGEEIDFTWQKASQTNQELANIDTMVADTYVKLGFKYDPKQPTASRLRVYINNIEYTTAVTGAQMQAATFPEGEELALLFATKVGTAAESKLQLDWWYAAQLTV